MTTNVDTRAVNVTGGKVARACDACTRRLRACWYCPADDAFLCQSCDVLIHSANQLAKRHERVRLPSPSPSPELMKTRKMEDKTNSVWYEGFRRKARTPRSKGLAFLQINSNDPLVPELGGEEEEDGFFSFSSIDENEDSLNCCVPVFDHFSSEMGTDDNGYGLVPDEINITTNLGVLGESEKEIMDDDGLIGLLPLDMNLGELTMDVESLLEEEQPLLGVTELNDIGLKEEDNIGFEINREALRRVKYEDEEEVKCDDGVSRDNDGEEESEDDQERKTNLFLSLDYEAVITAWDNHGSPWKIGFKSEFNLDECWQECLLGVNTYPLGRSETRQQERRGGGSDGERESKVMRYREKRRKRLFTKNIRYEVRKLNAEQRPRIKGRFVKRTSTNQVSL